MALSALPRWAGMLLGLLCACPHAQAEKELWLEHDIAPERPYVQQQIRYTLRLYQAVGLDNVRFVPPSAKYAEVHQLADTGPREADIGGRRYRVTERHYALFPFTSGELAIESGKVLANRPGATDAAELAIEAPSITVNVQPASAQPWLPAGELRLTESWSQKSASPRIGEALQRTIRIEADGLQAAQLPPITLSGTGFTAHALPPALEDRHEPEGIRSSREHTWLIVPTAAGALTIPPIAIEWFDVGKGANRRSTLPAYTLNVAPAAGEALETPTPNADEPAAASDQPATSTPDAQAPRDYHAPSAGTTLALILAIGLVSATFMLHRLRRKTPLRTLRAACRRNDSRAAYLAALAWTRHTGRPTPMTLLSFARRLDDSDLAQALSALDRARFGASSEPWEGQALLVALRKGRWRKHAPL